MNAPAADTPIHSVEVGIPIPVPDNAGDTWMPAWTPEGKLFSPSNDTSGFHQIGATSNVMFSEITGDDVRSLSGTTVNMMSDYRFHMEKGPDGAAWKTGGCVSVDGQLYLVVARHTYGEDSRDPHRRQTAQNASIIRSANGGRTWLRAAQDNYDHPMFPGHRFAAACFVNYGQDGHEAVADGSDKYVYALSNDGFWDNGDDVILGRIERALLPRLNAADWQFLRGENGADAAGWSPDVAQARPILVEQGKLGLTSAVYLPAQKCYLMIGWYYPAGGGKMPRAHVKTCWDFYTAPHPWGPWTNIGSHAWEPQGYYCPGVCPKFTSPDGSHVAVVTAGDWTNPEVYRLTIVPLTLR